MHTPTTRTLEDVLDHAKLGRFQIRVFLICFAVAALDGFDTQSIAFVVPALRLLWGDADSYFGMVFGAGLLGTMIGAPLFGGIADRVGRKTMVMASTALFGCMTLVSAFAPSLWILLVLRFITGLGLGGAMPNVIALASEYAPKSVRATVVTATFTGFSLGAILGGIISAWILTLFGWRSVFILGGALPLFLVAVIAARLPESARYLALKKGEQERVARIAAAIDPDAGPLRVEVALIDENGELKAGPRHLFTDGRAAWTVLIWLALFMGLFLAYFLVNWIPSLLMDAGLTQQHAVMGTVVLNAGGIAGSLLIGRLSDRLGPFVPIGFALASGSLAVIAIGFSSHSTALALTTIAAAGLLIFGAQLAMPAVLARHYPTFIRGTGVGWGIGLGRLGSVAGVITGGVLMSLGLAIHELFMLAAIPALVASLAIWAMSGQVPPPSLEERRAAAH